MSDYLGNLITRTLSHEAFVRPRLPSLFETSPPDYLAGLEFEQEGSSKSASASPAAPKSHSTTSEPEQEVFAESRLAAARLDTPRKIQPAILPPTESVLNQSAPPTPATHSFEPETMNVVKSPAEENRYPGNVREPSPDDLVQKSPDTRAKSHSVPIRVEAKTEVIAAESRKYSSPAEQIESDAPDRRANGDAISIAPRWTENAQRDISGPQKPVVRTEKVRAVKAIVPAIRNVPQVPLTPAQAAPAISVTIGRVEIRATTTPPPPQRAQPKSSKILSLESYLQQRAKGDQR